MTLLRAKETTFLDRARAIAPALQEAGPRIEEVRELPEDVRALLYDAGLFRMLLPGSLGGGELHPADYAEVIETVAAADGSTAWCLGQGSGCSMSSAYLEPAAAAEVFGDRRAVLAWGPGSGTAVKVDGGWRATGTWMYASGGRHATWLGGRCQVVDAQGRPVPGPDGLPAAHTMLFPKADTTWEDIWHVVGLRGTGSDRFSVADVFVADRHSFAPDYTLAADDKVRRYETGQLYKFPSVSLYATAFGAVALGIARATLDHFVGIARSKTPRGGQILLREEPVAQLQYGRAEVRLRAARAYLHATLREVWTDVAAAGRVDLDHRMEIRMAASHAIAESRQAVDDVYHVAGANAVFEANPLERRFRDVHAVSQQFNGRLQYFTAIGQQLLGLEIDPAFI